MVVTPATSPGSARLLNRTTPTQTPSLAQYLYLVQDTISTMEPEPEGITILGDLPDEELHLSNAVHETMRHITVNILTEFSTQDLYAHQYESPDGETEDQEATRLTLVGDICSMLTVIATAPAIALLDITWLDRRKQTLLRKALQDGVLDRPYVNRFLMATWSDIVDVRLGHADLDYEIPPIKIIVGMETFADETRPGHHHLGILYPFKEKLIQNKVFSLSDKSRRRKPTPQQRLTQFSRIYPQPRHESMDEKGDVTWKVFPKVIFPDLHAVIHCLLWNLVQKEFIQLKHLPYRRIILAFGVDQLTKRLLAYVNQEVLLLRHQEITVQK